MFARQLYGSGDDGVKLALHVVEYAVMEYELLVDEFADLVVSRNALDHMPDPGAALAEMQRVYLELEGDLEDR